MSISASVRLGPRGGTRRLRRHAALKAVSLAAFLIAGGGLTAAVALLTGLALFRCGLLTLIWIEVLPIPALAGLAVSCFGVLLLCLQALRDMPRNPICQISPGYRS